MTDDKGFLERWARRKAETRPPEEPERGEEAAPPKTESRDDPGGREPDEFDPATLPPIESLGPDSDYTAFLKAGVPAALRKAALRKAWSSKTAIAGHKPLVDYDWDFNAPGYGKLRPSDDPAKMVAALFRRVTEASRRREAEEAAASRPEGSVPEPPPEDLPAPGEPKTVEDRRADPDVSDREKG